MSATIFWTVYFESFFEKLLPKYLQWNVKMIFREIWNEHFNKKLVKTDSTIWKFLTFGNFSVIWFLHNIFLISLCSSPRLDIIWNPLSKFIYSWRIESMWREVIWVEIWEFKKTIRIEPGVLLLFEIMI